MSAANLLLILLLLACPLSMFFMHRGGRHSHRSRDDHSEHGARDSEAGPTAREPRQAHGGCGHAGHGGDSHHEKTKSGTPA